MFKGFVSKKLSSIPRFWSSRLFSTVNNKSQIPLETIEDIDIKYEDEAYYLKKDLIKIEDEKIRLYIISLYKEIKIMLVMRLQSIKREKSILY